MPLAASSTTLTGVMCVAMFSQELFSGAGSATTKGNSSGLASEICNKSWMAKRRSSGGGGGAAAPETPDGEAGSSGGGNKKRRTGA